MKAIRVRVEKKGLRFGLCLLILTAIWATVAGLQAQPSDLPEPDRITDRQGLPQAFVPAIVQDRRGFIWAATRDGLCRYDGQHFRVFQPSADGRPGLSYAGVNDLTLDHRGRIWITSERGDIDIVDPRTEAFINFSRQPAYQRAIGSHKPFRFCVDHRDRLWLILVGQGLVQFDLKSRQIKRFRHQPGQNHSIGSDALSDIVEGADGQIWVATANGLDGFDEKTGNFRHYPLPTDSTGLFSLPDRLYARPVGVPVGVPAIDAPTTVGSPTAKTPTGELLLFCGRRRVVRFQPRTGAYRIYDSPINLLDWVNSNFVSDRLGRVYFNNAGSLFRFTDQEGVRLLAHRPLDQPREKGNRLCIDRSNVLWEGTGGAGIRTYDLRPNPFRTAPYRHSFHVDLLSEPWLGIPPGQRTPTSVQSRATSYDFRYTVDGRPALWFNTGSSVIQHLDLTTKQLTERPLPRSFSNRDYGDFPCPLATDPGGAVWAVHDSLVWWYNEPQGRWLTWTRRIPVRQTGPVVLFTVDAKALWLATEQRGLWRLDRQTGRLRQYANRPGDNRSLSNDALFSLADDPQNPHRLWIGTFGSGLCAFDKRTGECRRFTVADGLPNNVIYSVIPDRQGYLWMGTNKGICRLNRRTFATQTFTRDDGLLADEFNRFHYVRLPGSDGPANDRIIMGGLEGITAFEPGRVGEDAFEPTVELTALHVNNQPIGSASTGSDRWNNPAWQRPVQAINELTVSHEQNYLTAEFAVLQFNRPTKNRYRYRLDGFDEQWTITDRPVAVYTALPPGRYVLWLNASNTSGRWSRHVRKLTVVIRSPFWATGWAYVLYGLTALGLGWSAVRTYRNRLRLRQSVALQQREIQWRQQEAEYLKGVDALKTRFFANITHEFRTPLTLILTPTEQMKHEPRGASDKHRLDTIDRNAHRLLELVNQLLDLAKLEAGQLRVDERRGDLAGFVEQTVGAFRTQAEATDIRLRLRTEGLSTTYWFDPFRLGPIVANLTANALKFTPAGGQVTVDLTTTQTGEVRLSVADTGAGIPANQLSFIFDRFYQVDDSPTRRHEGTGIGLALVKELVELQRGQITVVSDVGEGTTFTVWLPYRRADAPIGEIRNATPPSRPTNGQTALSVDRPPAPEPAIRPVRAPVVLIVEDNDELSHLIADSLPAAYQIQRAADGQAGVEAAFAHLPDLIISDVLMPRLDGYGLVERLKNDLRTSHIPILLLTAKAAQESRVEGLALGADDYLTKPFYATELQLRVRNLLAQQNRLRAWLRAQLVNPGPADPQPQTVSDGTPNLPPDGVGSHPFLDQLYVAIEGHLDDSTFGVEELAALANLSRTQLYRRVKALTDLPVVDLIRTYRLKRGAQLLQQGQSVSEAAYRVGFETPSYFSKCFKDVYGRLPSEYGHTG